VECNPTCVVNLLVGLPEVNVRGVPNDPDGPIRVHVESRADQGWCRQCGVRGQVQGLPAVELVDLLCFGHATRLVWHEHRLGCRESACLADSWRIVDPWMAWLQATSTRSVSMMWCCSTWAPGTTGKGARRSSTSAARPACSGRRGSHRQGRLRTDRRPARTARRTHLQSRRDPPEVRSIAGALCRRRDHIVT
jgi:hypothetical protein